MENIVSIEAEEEFMTALLEASSSGRIPWRREFREDEPDRDIYLTEVDGDGLTIEFSSVVLASQLQPGRNDGVVSFMHVNIYGMKVWIESSVGTKIFALARACVVTPGNAAAHEKSFRALRKATERVLGHNIRCRRDGLDGPRPEL